MGENSYIPWDQTLVFYTAGSTCTGRKPHRGQRSSGACVSCEQSHKCHIAEGKVMIWKIFGRQESLKICRNLNTANCKTPLKLSWSGFRDWEPEVAQCVSSIAGRLQGGEKGDWNMLFLLSSGICFSVPVCSRLVGEGLCRATAASLCPWWTQHLRSTLWVPSSQAPRSNYWVSWRLLYLPCALF